MMFSFDYGLMMLALFSILAQIILVLIAIAIGCISLLQLRRRPLNARLGWRCALIAVGLSMLVELWIALFFTPWRFPNSRQLLFLPLPSLQIGLCSLSLWITLDLFAKSNLSRMVHFTMSIVAVIVATGCIFWLQTWDRRRELLHEAENYAASYRLFMDTYRAETECNQHIILNKKCKRCIGRKVADDFYAKGSFKEAKYSADMEKAYRWAADHLGEPFPIVKRPK